MRPELEKYRPYVDGFDLTEAQKAELIHTLWTIMEAFADQAFGLHPAQLIPAALMQRDPPDTANDVDSDPVSTSNPIRQVAGASRRRKGTDHAGE
ncbi:hypothetical protein [Roseospira goensis]|uniref:Uncharacterized protein n=1 Tax=Roseospira goensis TaxID=391922 RepID=A0A7W6WL63_9PROT|nr:hypothetical protein [Roseospira goensis]MBB4286082.1 hypothetical protein [Roseospira goensis]